MPEPEVIVKTDNVSVRIMRLSAGQATEWHYHTQVTDNMFCLAGDVVIRLEKPAEEFHLAPGQRCKVEKHRVHQVANCGGTESAYLLVQGIGACDFNVVGIESARPPSPVSGT